MDKTKKQRTINKLLTLMLAFVMVLTGMGIGSWGVSEAWADDTTWLVKQKIIAHLEPLGEGRTIDIDGAVALTEINRLGAAPFAWVAFCRKGRA